MLSQPTYSHICTVVLLTTLILAPTSMATPTTTLEVSSATVGPGSSGELNPLFFTLEQPLGGSATTPPDFFLKAEKIHVEVDHATSITTGMAGHMVPGNTTYGEYATSTIKGTQNRNNYRLMVIPEGSQGLHVQSMCATLSSPNEGKIQREGRAANPSMRQPVRMDESDSLQWQNCGRSHLTFTGNFTLVLWDWDAVVTDASGSTEYTTGHFQHEATSDLPGDSDVIGERREAWFFVTDGQLELDLERESPSLLYAGEGARVSTSSSILFQDAWGEIQLDGYSQEVGGQDVQVQGILDVDLSRQATGNSMAVAVQGDVWRLAVDGAELATISPIPSANPWSWTWIAGAALGVTITSLLAYALVAPIRRWNRLHDQWQLDQAPSTQRERWAAGHIIQGDQAMQARAVRTRWAKVHAQLARIAWPGLADARLLLGHACHHQGDVKGAIDQFQRARHLSRTNQGMAIVSMQFAQIALERGQHDTVRAMILDAKAHHPETALKGIESLYGRLKSSKGPEDLIGFT